MICKVHRWRILDQLGNGYRVWCVRCGCLGAGDGPRVFEVTDMPENIRPPANQNGDKKT